MMQRIKNWLLRHCLNAIVLTDVIRQEKGKTYLGQEEITEQELKQLQAEVKALEKFRIWSIATNSLKLIAQDKIFNKSEKFDDVTMGKAMLYNISLTESIVKLFREKKS